jgi:DNA-binding PadR family transcriptional regulator
MRLLSENAARILAEFLRYPDTPRYGYELMRDSGIKSGSLYPVLGRFEKLEWITGTMEPSVDGRPPRRVYRVNPDGVASAQQALDRYFDEKQIAAPESLNWGF